MIEMIRSVATPGELVTTVAEVTGVARPTVADIDRRLAAAGLRTVGGRGLSAAKMTAKDAAYLLIALLTGASATEVVAETVAAADAVSLPTPFGDNDDAWHLDWLPQPIITLGPGHTFGEMLTALLEVAQAGVLSSRIDAGYDAAVKDCEDHGRDGRGLGVGVHISISSGRPTALISAGWGEHHSYDAVERPGDLLRSRELGLKTLERVGSLLGGRQLREATDV